TSEGRSSGRVMLQNVRQLPAPSSSAASYMLRAVALMPAVRIATADPSEAHACTTATAGRAIDGSDRKPIELTPRALSTALMSPAGSYSIFQTLPIATTVATTGRK